MLGSYKTLAAVGAILGVSEQRVLELVEHGPLVAVRREMGLMVHEEDLAAFRRPLGIATTRDNSTPYGSEMLRFANPAAAGVVLSTTEHDPLIIGLCGSKGKAARHLRLVR